MEPSKARVEITVALREFYDAETALKAKETGKGYDRMDRAWEGLRKAMRDHSCVEVRATFRQMFPEYLGNRVTEGMHSYIDSAAETELAKQMSDYDLVLQYKEATKRMKDTAGEAHWRASRRKIAANDEMLIRYQREEQGLDRYTGLPWGIDP
ncbi:hypothetical protein [Kocuria rosea]|uniref:hypothetical protein n=1 Tax=Kocuria rosea TaxID=1275 RepID=UPI00119F2B0D|nr:hypothetical protein [Kocuria rosea]